jgi:COP9 signalosome complex subunit 8
LAYLITNDLNNARFLWKRIPQELKKNNISIQSVWKIGQTMWKREYEETYKAITVPEWEPVLQPLLRALVDAFRHRTALLLTKSYTTISLSDTCSFLGLNEQDATQYVHNLHWTYDPNTKFFTPNKDFLFTQQVQAQKQSGTHTLNSLSDKTVFLELN